MKTNTAPRSAWKRNRSLALLVLALGTFSLSFMVSCMPDKKPVTTSTGTSGTSSTSSTPEKALPASVIEGKGLGEVKSVELKTPLEAERVNRGKSIYDMKCSACHQLTTKKVVGPGWSGITRNRKPEWIMNMITNVEVMLDTDPEAQKLLQLCMTRMPNQNVSIGDARDVLEFMRQNDGEK
jgi:mono/diheme cytochrome c family protein